MPEAFSPVQRLFPSCMKPFLLREKDFYVCWRRFARYEPLLMLRFQYADLNKPVNVRLQEVNSGLFWATKLNVTRIGHNGSDPGVHTEMLSNLSKDVGVILFTNTSLSGEAMRNFLAISRKFWKHAEALKDEGRRR